jgi:hypothetical protein
VNEKTKDDFRFYLSHHPAIGSVRLDEVAMHARSKVKSIQSSFIFDAKECIWEFHPAEGGP